MFRKRERQGLYVSRTTNSHLIRSIVAQAVEWTQNTSDEDGGPFNDAINAKGIPSTGYSETLLCPGIHPMKSLVQRGFGFTRPRKIEERRKKPCIKRESNPRRVDAARHLVATTQVTTTPLMPVCSCRMFRHRLRSAARTQILTIKLNLPHDSSWASTRGSKVKC